MSEIGTTDYKSAQLLLLVNNSEDSKHRISEELGEEFTKRLYQAFVEDTLDTLETAGLRYAISEYATGPSIGKWLNRDVEIYSQRGDSPADRVKNTFIDAFSRGEEKVIVIVSDVPDIPAEELLEAVYSLKDSEAVIGPAVDGGYNILGFSKDSFRESAFDNISWGTDMAFADTAEKLGGMTIHLLSPWPDVDTVANLRALVKDKRNSNFSSSRTLAVLSETNLVGNNACGFN